MRANSALSVSALTFQTETYFDHLTIGGTCFSGTSGPMNVAMASGDTLMFYADWSASAGGFTICGSTTPATVASPALARRWP